ncbi:hypothetical protein MASR2M15_21690 [Anaerolineales bacterium]
MTLLDPSISAYLDAQPRYDHIRKVVRPLLHLALSSFAKISVTGQENIPATGPAILMINHISYMDPALVTAVIKNRYAISMSKAENLDSFLPRIVIKTWGHFVVHRNMVDRKALIIAVELVSNGQLLLMAPEGTRRPKGLKEAREGLAYIGLKSDAIIIPTALWGINDWKQHIKRFKRVPTGIRFGTPFRFVSHNEAVNKQVRHQMMQEAMYQLAKTIPNEVASLRGVYSDLSKSTTEFIELIDQDELNKY